MIRAIVFDAYGTLFDVQSVADVTDAAFPGHGSTITQIWRLKQLEYSWLHALMGRYVDFWQVTQEALTYTLGTLGLTADARLFDEIAETYNRLTPFPDAAAALDALGDYKRAILSNGSPDMLAAVVGHSGLDTRLDAILSVHSKRVFKPDPRAYGLLEDQLGVRPEEALFVSSNGFDVCGAKSVGFRVARIARISPDALRQALQSESPPTPATVFKALRSQQETCGAPADAEISSLAELPALVRALADEPARAS
ncbi:haloacid dehalogenase type II [Aquabacter spiritensis]|uniref:(S)-2-haloacid dehalogenase n=1 Tax=Aquabacter spiritensis TaxID=933073 RepID=A0A4V2UXW9_9HYPH|nr:haloacid dehalogenase type II [Aquabacter spiritensis]TCT05128.1 2-haloacid dehalogenase [Aquabacter spiritensis]